MSFTPEIFRKKLDNLQETQDSIVSISQWVLFHHRHAVQLCELWSQYVLTNQNAASSKKKLSLLYLCNDVVQQARHKRKPEFASGFAAILPKVLHSIYAAVDDPIKPKIDRLVSVWSERSIFAQNQISAMQSAIRSSAAGKPMDAGSAAPEPVSSPVAVDLVHLNNLYQHLAQLQATSTSNLAQVGAQSKSYLPDDPAAQDNLPSPRVYASKLNVLEKLCQMTTQNLADVKSARQDILKVLASLTETISEGLRADDAKVAIIEGKLSQLQSTRADLQEMLRDEPEQDHQESVPNVADTQSSGPQVPEDEEPSPSFQTNDDAIPTYVDSSDDSDDEPPRAPKELPSTLKRSLSDASTSSAKKVAFSENIEVKEYERDDHTEPIIIAPDNGDSPPDDSPDDDEENLQEFSTHHKDAVELMHKNHSSDEDNYDPSSLGDGDSKSGLMDLLSKLN